jgi:glycosyltransferase involved in cell wall biosynthesis
MLKILVLTRYDRLGASSRVRFLQFMNALRERGMLFFVQPLLDNDYIRGLYSGKRAKAGEIIAAYLKRLWILLRVRRYDLVWMEKEALPWFPAALELVLMRGMPYVVDFDDAWFHRYDHSQSPIVRALMAGKIDAVMRHAAVVVVGNEYLADRARRAKARRVEIIPSVVDFNRYAPEIIVNAGDSARKNPVVIGWIGTPITARYLLGFEPAFRAIAAIRPIELHVVGASAPAAFAGLPVKNVVWNEATEIEAILAFDIGIMPLDDTTWERGKCAYKLLQVMAAGRPVVASPVGANCAVVRDGINGFLADTTDRWIEALTALIDDADLRARMGREATQTIKDQYTVERVLPQLASVLTEAPVLRD